MRIVFFIIFILLSSCKLSDEKMKPALTIEQYEKEVKTIRHILDKFLGETDSVKLHQVSLGLESTFSVDCTPIGEECYLYHKLITKIIQSTKDGKFSMEDKMEVSKMNDELDKTFTQTRIKLLEAWKLQK